LVIEFTVQEKGEIVDISSASATKQIIFKKPDATTTTKSGSFVTNGTDGKFYYTTIAGDIDQAGAWQAQAYIVTGSFVGYSMPVAFTVNDNL
jgi:hypothetical protein